MQFRISDTFTSSLARLTTREQTAAKITAFDLQTDPSGPGLQMHRVVGARDGNFWSARVNRDIRVIVHRQGENVTLCYVDHHDDAYRWAERRRLEPHPRTGAAQLIEIRETVEEIRVPVYVDEPVARPRLFDRVSDDELLGYGVPEEWLTDVRAATEDSVLDLADHLPAEAAEAVLALAVGETPQPALPGPVGSDPFNHPDALRRFRALADVEELQQALDYPWEKWSVFLHPAQREIVERGYSGPARVSGSAGTGKTVVALHRAVFLARADPNSRVLLTTFSDTLASALFQKLTVLVRNEPRIAERLEVLSMDAIARRLYRTVFGRPTFATDERIAELLEEEVSKAAGLTFSSRFVLTEWNQVVDAWGLESWEAYRDAQRLGRRRRLSQGQREALWPVFEGVRRSLNNEDLITKSDLYRQLAETLSQRVHPVFNHVVVDESQDVDIPQMRFLAALGGYRSNGLFFAGDLGQRIFQQPYSWRTLGVDIRGRSRTLKINYRTSHQIRVQADRLLDPELSDVDGVTERRRGTVSVFNGPQPTVEVLEDEEAEAAAVGEWLRCVVADGVPPHEVSVFVRSDNELERAREAVAAAGLESTVMQSTVRTTEGNVSIGTMHLAKGLEFRAVAVMACDDSVIPLEERIESIVDESDLADVYNTERHLLYVACTRARDYLLVTAVAPGSEFLDDLGT